MVGNSPSVSCHGDDDSARSAQGLQRSSSSVKRRVAASKYDLVKVRVVGAEVVRWW